MIFTLPQLDFWSIAPVLGMTLTGCLVMLADIFTPRRAEKSHLANLSLVGLAVTAALSHLTWDYDNRFASSGMDVADNFTQFFKLLFVSITTVTVLLSQTQLKHKDCHAGEFYYL